MSSACSHCHVASNCSSKPGGGSRQPATGALATSASASSDCCQIRSGCPKAVNSRRATVLPTPGASASRSHAASSSRSMAMLLFGADDSVANLHGVVDLEDQRIRHPLEGPEHQQQPVALVRQLDGAVLAGLRAVDPLLLALFH